MGLLDTISNGFASGGVGLGVSALSNALGIQSSGQQSLTDQSVEAQEKLMDYQNKLQMQNYRTTYDMQNYQSQVNQMKEAGLNPAMMYAKGGGSGTEATTGSTSASMSTGQASDSASMINAGTQMAGMGLQAQALQSQIDVNKSIALKNTAEAANAGANTNTTDAIS